MSKVKNSKTYAKKLKIFLLIIIFLVTFISGSVLLDLSGEKIGIANIIFDLPNRIIRLLNFESQKENLLDNVLLDVYSGINILETSILSTNNQNEVFCSNKVDLNSCIKENKGKKIILFDDIYYSNVLDLFSNTTLIIPKNTTLTIDKNIEWDKYCKTCVSGDAAIIRVNGTKDRPISNVHIILNGSIKGSDENIAKDNRYEGIAFKYVFDSTISGTGRISNIHGDGIDLDASSNILIKDLFVENNSGTGVHMGSPRPLDTNSSVYVRNITATNNGYYFERAGFDNSWPNEFSLVLIGNKSDSNYINYDIQGYGVIMIDNESIGTVFVQDKLEGAIINYDFSN